MYILIKQENITICRKLSHLKSIYLYGVKQIGKWSITSKQRSKTVNNQYDDVCKYTETVM